jgi:hypothetical protein
MTTRTTRLKNASGDGTKTALGALVRACYWGSTPTVRIWWVLQQAGMDWTKIGEFVDQCVAARVLEKHRYGTWLSMTGAGRQLYKDFDRISGLADSGLDTGG